MVSNQGNANQKPDDGCEETKAPNNQDPESIFAMVQAKMHQKVPRVPE